jgi:hypothetical protein
VECWINIGSMDSNIVNLLLRILGAIWELAGSELCSLIDIVILP